MTAGAPVGHPGAHSTTPVARALLGPGEEGGPENGRGEGVLNAKGTAVYRQETVDEHSRPGYYSSEKRTSLGQRGVKGSSLKEPEAVRTDVLGN